MHMCKGDWRGTPLTGWEDADLALGEGVFLPPRKAVGKILNLLLLGPLIRSWQDFGWSESPPCGILKAGSQLVPSCLVIFSPQQWTSYFVQRRWDHYVIHFRDVTEKNCFYFPISYTLWRLGGSTSIMSWCAVVLMEEHPTFVGLATLAGMHRMFLQCIEYNYNTCGSGASEKRCVAGPCSY